MEAQEVTQFIQGHKAKAWWGPDSNTESLNTKLYASLHKLLSSKVKGPLQERGHLLLPWPPALITAQREILPK